MLAAIFSLSVLGIALGFALGTAARYLKVEGNPLKEEIEATGQYDVDDQGPRQFRFDLCPDCHPRFVSDPLGRERLLRVKYSAN